MRLRNELHSMPSRGIATQQDILVRRKPLRWRCVKHIKRHSCCLMSWPRVLWHKSSGCE